jgi:TPR repeat protein
MVSRNSLVFAGLQTPHFEWKEPLFESSPPSQSGRVPSPDSLPKDAPQRIVVVDTTPPEPPTQDPIFSARVDPVATVPTVLARQSYDVPRTESSLNPSRAGLQRSHSENLDDSKSSSADSASTIRPQTGRATASAAINITAEEHVAKGIECHENGALQESTYHLRIAAKQDHPTGMLLYALACRHGWGMRPNQREGVQWLRRAVDSVGFDVAENDDSRLGGKDAAERKARRAQFALGIYELGVSHLNGWGIEQDKSLALRCFEIAGRWGDADALAEAGFCYAEGIGCKKDLKKAAQYYRMAEAKGMSMVGNSWYGFPSATIPAV